MNTNKTINIFFSLNLFCIASYSYSMLDEVMLTPCEDQFWQEILDAQAEISIINSPFFNKKSCKKKLNEIDDNLKNKLEKLLNDGANPNTKKPFSIIGYNLNGFEEHPLSATVKMNLVNSTALLLERNGDINYISSLDGNNLLHLANSANMVTLLIQSGVDTKFSSPTKYNYFNSFVCSDLTTLEDTQEVYETYVPEIKKTNAEGIEIPLSQTRPGILHNLAYEAKIEPNWHHEFITTELSLYKKAAYLMSLGVHNSYKDSNGLTPQQIINTTGYTKLKNLFNDPKVQKKAIKEIQINQENIFTQLKKRESGRLNKIKLH